MGSWQKIITSGSMAQLSSLIVDNITPDLEGGSVLTYLTESGKFRITGSYKVGSGNGDTSSFAHNAFSSSYALSASNVLSSSYALSASNVLSSSYALSASNALNATSAVSGGASGVEFHVVSDAYVSGNLQVSGSIAAAEGITLTDVSMSLSTSTGSFIFGSGSYDNELSHEMTGNLALSSSGGITANMPVDTIGFHGTASHASQSVSASYVLSASFASDSDSASFASDSNSASYALSASNVLSSSYALTSSFTTSSHSSSYAVTSSYTFIAQTLLGNVNSATTASYAETASFLEGSVTSASYAVTSSFLEGSVISASYAVTASHAVNASLPINPSFTTITSSGNVLIGGGLEVTNGSTFNSGVDIDGNLNIDNILSINNKFKISASNTEVNFISETITTTQTGDETIFVFGSKPGASELDTFIEISSLAEKSKGLRFRDKTIGPVSTIESNKDGIITISGSGHADAGSVVFKGKKITIGENTIIKGEGTNLFGFPSSIQIDNPLAVAGGITALAISSTGTISCGGMLNLGTTQLTGLLTMGPPGQSTQLSISNNGKIHTTGSIETLQGFIGDLTGTSSYATSASNALVATLASSSVNAMNCIFTSSYADSASYALTASFIDSNITVAGAITSSYTDGTASYADSASFTHDAHSSSYAVFSSQSLSTFGTSSYANSASFAITTSGTSSYADSASFAITTSGTASYANSASFALSAFNSTTASYALNIPDGLGGGGGLWFDGTTYWSSSLQGNGDVTKIGIGRLPVNYSLEVNGTMAATADVIAFMSSDKRLKNNIKPIENPIEKIKQIGGYSFDWNDKQNIYKGSDFGVIAQEIEQVLPSLVQNREDGYKGVKYDKIVSLLIEAIKDQQKQIDELKKLI